MILFFKKYSIIALIFSKSTERNYLYSTDKVKQQRKCTYVFLKNQLTLQNLCTSTVKKRILHYFKKWTLYYIYNYVLPFSHLTFLKCIDENVSSRSPIGVWVLMLNKYWRHYIIKLFLGHRFTLNFETLFIYLFFITF